MALFLFQILLLLGMVAASFYLLYRYATYGDSESQEPVTGNRNANIFRKENEEKKTAGENGTEQEDTESFDAVNETREVHDTVQTEGTKSGQVQIESDVLFETIQTAEPIRVQILGNQYLSPYHDQIAVKSEGSFTVRCHTQEKKVKAGEIWAITAEELKNLWERETGKKAEGDTCVACIESDSGQSLILPDLVRGQIAPAYAGSFQLYLREEKLLLVNEVPLEEYLCSVVSSEMPYDYPQEALCAQAVCARTYAVHCMEREKNKNSVSDLDDSVSFQVYNNYKSNEASTQAVRKTEGEILNCDEVLYYSTSCQTEGRTDLGTDEAFWKFLNTEPAEDAEYGSPWIRWSVILEGQKILEQLQALYGCRWEELEQIDILERNPEGQVQKIRCSNGNDHLDIEGEYQIRNVLSVEGEAITLKNGQSASGMQLLPSAYFCIERRNGTSETDAERSSGQNILFRISGGGYGHGTGMSQYGAAAMAASGAGYREILKFYYESSAAD